MRLLETNWESGHPQPDYGHDYFGNLVKPEAGYILVIEGDTILEGDKPFDVYAGWISGGSYHAEMGHHARSAGRWTTWERKANDNT